MPAQAFAHMWQTLKSARSWMGLVKNRCKNGDHYWVSAYVTPVTQNGVAVEYQSVRTRPDARWVAAAERVYAQLRGELKGRRSLLRLGLRGRITALASALLGLVLGIEAWLRPESAWIDGTAFVVGSSVCALGVRWILRPLERLNERARQVADNPLSQGIYTGRSDEFGQIEFALQMLEAQVGAVVGRMGDASQQLAGHAAQLVDHLQISHSSSLAQQAETDQVAAAIHQMAASVAQVASHAQQASVAADLADTETREGHWLVGESRSAVLRLAEELRRATEVIHQLEGHSSEISGCWR